MRIFGFEIKKNKSVKKDVELGSSGTTIFGGMISGEEYVPKLQGTTAISTYDKMRKSDGVVKAALLACQLPIRATGWDVEPASDDKQDQEVAEFVKNNLMEGMSITWADFLRQSLLMLPFGYMIFEKVYTDFDWQGKQMIGLKKLAPRLPETVLKWETSDKKAGITQMTNVSGEISIPMDKLIVFVNDKEGDNWQGISVLRSAYRPWYFKEHIEKINAMSFERQGLGIPTITLPEGHTTADEKKAKEILQNIRANEQAYILLPPGWTFEYADPKARGIKDPKESIQRYNREILISVLAQFMDLGSGNYGSRSLSVDQSTTFHNNLTAIANQIRDTINKYVIQQLVDLNYNVKEYPSLSFGQIGIVDYEKLSKSLSNLIQSGAMMPDDQLEDYLRQVMRLPERPEDTTREGEPKKKASDELMIFWEPWRPFTFAEKKVNLKHLNREIERAENELKKKLKGISKKSQDDFIAQLERIIATKDNALRKKRIKNLGMKYKGEYQKAILSSLKDIYETGKTSVAHEMKKKVPTTPQRDISNMSLQARALTTRMDNEVTNSAKLTVLNNLQRRMPKTEAVALATNEVKKKIKRNYINTPSVVVNGGLNQGRRRTMVQYKDDIYALQRSEILDRRTCDYCLSIDGRIVRKKSRMARMNLVHTHCRGIWVEILKDEKFKPKISGIPKSLQDKWGGMGNMVKQPSKPIVKKDSWVVKHHPELLQKKK